MKKVISALLLCIGVSATISAQKITWGTEQPNTSDRPIQRILGYDDKGYYVVREENPHPHVVNASFALLVTLEKYDYSGNRIFSTDCNVTENGDKYNFDRIFYMKNNIVTTMYAPDVKTLYAMKVASDGSIDNKNKVLIGTVENKWKKEIMPEVRYHFILSEDKSTLIGYYRKNKEKVMTLIAISDAPKVLWSKEITLPFDGDFNIGGFKSSGNNTYFMVYEKKPKEDKNTRYILTYDNTTGKLQKTDMTIDLGGDKVLKDIEWQIDKYNYDLVFAGLYSTDASKGDAMGGYVVRVDHSTGQIVKNTFEFDNKFLSTIISQKMIDKGRGIPSLGLNDFSIMSDKSVIFTTEQYSGYGGQKGGEWVGAVGPGNQPIMGQGSFNPGVAANYDYNDAVIAKINADGTIAWINKIAKRQEGYTMALSSMVCSYSTFVSGNTLYILYTENKKNLSLPPAATANDEDKLSSTPQVEGYPERASQVVTTIDITSGEMKRNIINAEEDKKNEFYTTLAMQVKPNTVVVYKGSKKGGQFGQLTLQ